MRHGPLGTTLSISSLTAAVRFLTDSGRLVTAARCQYLFSPHSLPAGVAAIALPARFTASTDSEDSIAIGIDAVAWAKPIRGAIRRLGLGHPTTIPETLDDWTDDWRLRRPMMSLASARTTFRKLRFLMIAGRGRPLPRPTGLPVRQTPTSPPVGVLQNNQPGADGQYRRRGLSSRRLLKELPLTEWRRPSRGAAGTLPDTMRDNTQRATGQSLRLPGGPGSTG